jgi:hypothetical protein
MHDVMWLAVEVGALVALLLGVVFVGGTIGRVR